MRRYLFFCRVALLGNIFFVAMMFMKGFHMHLPFAAEEFIIAMALLGLTVNILVNITGVVLAVLKKGFFKEVPLWLITFNFIVLAVQVFHLMHLRIES